MRFRICFKHFILLVSLGLCSHAAEAQTRFQKAKIVRNCTGTYLQFNHHNYLVYNAEFLADWEDNKKVNVEMKEVLKAPVVEGEICALYFEYKGIVEITATKPKRKDRKK